MFNNLQSRFNGWTRLWLLAALAIAGCEDREETLNVEPSFVTISTSTNTVSFRVTGDATNATFATPITWSVSQPALGTISRSSAFAALYVGSDAVGDNIVTARDNLGNEGYATVRRTGEEGTLTLSPNPATIPAGSKTSLITATGGTAPFTWWTRDTSLGRIISAADSDTAVYESSRPGVNVVHARDVNGLTGTTTITQLDATSTTNTETTTTNTTTNTPPDNVED